MRFNIKKFANQTTVGRVALIPTQAKITNKIASFKGCSLCLYDFVVLNILLMQIDVGMRATRPTELQYV